MSQQPDANDPRVFTMDGAVAYGSIEEMLEEMGRAEIRAIEEATPRQWAITYGDVVLKPDPSRSLLIFGRIHTKAERDKGEDAYTVSRLDDAYRRGYRTGRWHSDIVPEGEEGDSHISTLWPIAVEEFEEAEALNFSTQLIASLPWGREMLKRVHDEAGAEMGATVDTDGAGFTVVQEDPS